MPDVVAVGAAAVDMVARVDRFPEPDEIILVKSFERLPGGSTANVAVALARLGVSVGFLGKVGGDENGRLLLEDFERHGVDASRVIVAEGERSASTFIAVDSEGRRVIYALGGKALLESSEEVDLDYLLSSRIAYVGEAFPEVMLGALQSAKEKGIGVVYAPGGVFCSFGLDFIRPLLELADVILLSRRELETLTGTEDVSAGIRSLNSIVAGDIVVTAGEEGSIVATRSGLSRVPALRPQKVVDTTGAGDAFAAGLVYGLLQGWSLSESAKFGSAVAAIKVASEGPRGGLPTAEEALRFLQTAEPL